MMGYTLYALNDNVTFVHLPHEAYVVNANNTPPTHQFTEDYFDRSILCTLCDIKHQDKPGITSANILLAIGEVFHPNQQPTLQEVETWLNSYLNSPDNIVKKIENSAVEGGTVDFKPVGPKNDKTLGNMQPGNKTKTTWGKALASNPLPPRCCF